MGTAPGHSIIVATSQLRDVGKCHPWELTPHQKACASPAAWRPIRWPGMGSGHSRQWTTALQAWGGILAASQPARKGLNYYKQENSKTEIHFKHVISHHVALFRKLLELGGDRAYSLSQSWCVSRRLLLCM